MCGRRNHALLVLLVFLLALQVFTFASRHKAETRVPRLVPQMFALFAAKKEHNDIRKIFQRIAPLLSQRQRIVLVLREIYGMEMTEIAELLHCTESTVRNHLSQAKDSFRKKIKELFPEYEM